MHVEVCFITMCVEECLCMPVCEYNRLGKIKHKTSIITFKHFHYFLHKTQKIIEQINQPKGKKDKKRKEKKKE